VIVVMLAEAVFMMTETEFMIFIIGGGTHRALGLKSPQYLGPIIAF
jgi:hypothetical protein